jgi:hypothetical protein
MDARVATAPTAAEGASSAQMLTHLQRLEAESIHIMREVVAECERPVMLYSIGKDSAVMLHLAAKAFYPSKPPFPLLHVDTTWKFRAMYEMRERMARELGFELLVHQNPDAVARGINPFDHGSALHTDIWKTEGLKQALDKYGFDAAFGGHWGRLSLVKGEVIPRPCEDRVKTLLTMRLTEEIQNWVSSLLFSDAHDLFGVSIFSAHPTRRHLGGRPYIQLGEEFASQGNFSKSLRKKFE